MDPFLKELEELDGSEDDQSQESDFVEPNNAEYAGLMASSELKDLLSTID
jgi:hypothetical protein